MATKTSGGGLFDDPFFKQLGFGFTSDAPVYEDVDIASGAQNLADSQVNRAMGGRRALADAMMRGVDQRGLVGGAGQQIQNFSQGLGGDQSRLMGNALTNRMSRRAANDLGNISNQQENKARLMHARDLSDASTVRSNQANIARGKIARVEDQYKNQDAAKKLGINQLIGGLGTIGGAVVGGLMGGGKGAKEGGKKGAAAGDMVSGFVK